LKTLTVIQKNHAGLLAEVTAVLEQAKIEILDFAGQVVGDTAVISLQLRPYQAAFRLLSNAGYRVISHNHLLVRLDRHPGALAALSRRLAEAQVDVRGMHIVNKDEAACIVALEATQVDKARDVLSDLLVVERPRRKA
jgi:hypothetical protein